MGRKKKLRTQLEKDGNPGRLPMPAPDPATRTDIISTIDLSRPPKNLNKHGIEYFKSIVSLAPWLLPADLPTIALACETYQSLREIEKDLDEWRKRYKGIKGMESGALMSVSKPSHDETIINPLSKLKLQYLKTLEGHLRLLALSPLQRQQLADTKSFQDTHNKNAEFLK